MWGSWPCSGPTFAAPPSPPPKVREPPGTQAALHLSTATLEEFNTFTFTSLYSSLQTGCNLGKCCHAHYSALFHLQNRRSFCLSFSYCSQTIESFQLRDLETGGRKEFTNCTVTATHILFSAWLQNRKLHLSSCTCTWRCSSTQLLQEHPL